MAVLNMGVIVTDIRGKLNGNQFNKTRSGNILQRKCNQKKGGSAEQSYKRATFSTFARYWRTLSDGDRAANNANTSSYPVLDRFGNTKFLSGFQLLLRSNVNLATIGSSPIDVVPGTPPDGAGIVVTSMTIEVSAGVATVAEFLTTDLSGDWMNKIMVLYVSPGVSPGITNYNGRFNYMYQAAPDETTFDFLANYIARVPAPSPGTRVFGILDLMDLATGIVVSSYRFSTIVTT